MKCPRCGWEMEGTVPVCPNCGYPLREEFQVSRVPLYDPYSKLEEILRRLRDLERRVAELEARLNRVKYV